MKYFNLKAVSKLFEGNDYVLYSLVNKNDEVKGTLLQIRYPNEKLFKRLLIKFKGNLSEIEHYIENETYDKIYEFNVLNIISMNSFKNVVHSRKIEVQKSKDLKHYNILFLLEEILPFRKYLKTHTLDEEEIIEIGLSLLSALESFHENGIFYGELNLDSIFLNSVGDFILINPYLFSFLEISQNEKLSFLEIDNQDQTTDFYLLGQILKDLIENYSYQDIKNSNLKAVIDKTSSNNINDRYKTGNEFRNDLLNVQSNLRKQSNFEDTISTTPVTPVNHNYNSVDIQNSSITAPKRSYSWLFWLISILSILGIGFLYFYDFNPDYSYKETSPIVSEESNINTENESNETPIAEEVPVVEPPETRQKEYLPIEAYIPNNNDGIDLAQYIGKSVDTLLADYGDVVIPAIINDTGEEVYSDSSFASTIKYDGNRIINFIETSEGSPFTIGGIRAGGEPAEAQTNFDNIVADKEGLYMNRFVDYDLIIYEDEFKYYPEAYVHISLKNDLVYRTFITTITEESTFYKVDHMHDNE